ncbi:MAG: hypothetical protein ACC660_04090, partial [Acidimicrobiales bacterium]
MAADPCTRGERPPSARTTLRKTGLRSRGGLRRLGGGLRLEWRELGRLGRAGMVGVVLAGFLAVGLGLTIQDVARSELLRSRAAILTRVVDDLPADISMFEPGSGPYEEFNSAVRLRLLGGETVRVKVWAPDGTVVYSDAPSLVGKRFELGPDAQAAFGGEPSYERADLDGPENVYDGEFGDLVEFYLPVRDASGKVVGVFEVYERSESLNESLGEIRGDLWWSIAVGLAVLALSLGGLTLAIAQALNRRRRLAEELSGSLTRARDEERRRIIAALHDDVSQPLYRILFGLQGCRRRVVERSVADEMERLEHLTREIEVSIRSELRNLHGPMAEEMGLEPAVGHLVESARDETDMVIELDSGDTLDLSPEVGSAVYRAVQESLFNVRRHAAASRVSVSITAEGHEVIAYVVDDGVGWNGREGIGLATTRQILQAV